MRKIDMKKIQGSLKFPNSNKKITYQIVHRNCTLSLFQICLVSYYVSLQAIISPCNSMYELLMESIV